MTGDTDTGAPLLLCCLLWAREGQRTGLGAYEDKVIARLVEHGAELLERVRSAGADDVPDEVQLYRFPDQAALDAFLVDPFRLALTAERDQVVERTVLFPVTQL